MLGQPETGEVQVVELLRQLQGVAQRLPGRAALGDGGEIQRRKSGFREKFHQFSFVIQVSRRLCAAAQQGCVALAGLLFGGPCQQGCGHTDVPH
ncbi:hypothetical protein D3C75_978600 [compost metagenome]